MAYSRRGVYTLSVYARRRCSYVLCSVNDFYPYFLFCNYGTCRRCRTPDEENQSSNLYAAYHRGWFYLPWFSGMGVEKFY